MFAEVGDEVAVERNREVGSTVGEKRIPVFAILVVECADVHYVAAIVAQGYVEVVIAAPVHVANVGTLTPSKYG